MPPRYTEVGGLIFLRTLDAPGAPGLLALGFRITDQGGEKWSRRFNAFKGGDPVAVAAAARTMTAAIRGTRDTPGIKIPKTRRVVVVGAISSGDSVLREGCPVSRLGSALAEANGWEWRPELLRKSPHRSLHKISTAGERDAELAERYVSGGVGGPPGAFLITDDFCTRGTTAAEIRRALHSANPGWKYLAICLAKTERVAYWGTGLNNNHIPHALERVWQGR